MNNTNKQKKMFLSLFLNRKERKVVVVYYLAVAKKSATKKDLRYPDACCCVVNPQRERGSRHIGKHERASIFALLQDNMYIIVMLSNNICNATNNSINSQKHNYKLFNAFV